ncbi:MAG: tRNA preQ1(34) S-adenosylmethionine ribosyltransferase-isomerase QueA [Bacilli bacterium]|jgi:S-adenosylmethionine:tRNA ribosyltransferase-isomerase|nr:tRNA preQ1(34) S-adenosylmethionine ribosyltransferase-isomerase QueA [Bacilli bacterium]
MDVKLFDFDLDETLIAQSPSEKRDHSRLLVLDVEHQKYQDDMFYHIDRYLKPGDVLVRNNTKVIPARLLGVKEKTQAHVEVLLLQEIEKDVWECLCGNAKTIKLNTKINFGEGKLSATCLEVKDEGLRIMRFDYRGIFLEILEQLGKMPLPPYIKKQICGNDRYQTVYAKIDGSAAAPTAGFHFTDEMLKKIQETGVEICDITLHIGLGTFRPVKVADTKDHIMHAEVYQIDEKTAEKLNRAKDEKRRVIAVGTTSTRTLESNIKKYGVFKATKEVTNIFIEPGYKFKAIDALITNFHLPKSTLLMLVSALAGREFILEVYQHAIKEKYRFFSFGDGMLIYGKR